MRRLSVFALFVLLALPLSAHAGLIIQTGDNPQPNEESVLFNLPGLTPLGLTVTGRTADTGWLVNFTGTETLATPSTGEARVTAYDGTLTAFTLTVPGATFLDYIFNLNAPAGVSGSVTIQVVAQAGATLTGTFGVINPGSNFFTTYSTEGDRIASVNVTTTFALLDVQSNQISGLPPVPEPASVFTFAAGLAAFGFRRWRRRT